MSPLPDESENQELEIDNDVREVKGIANIQTDIDCDQVDQVDEVDDNKPDDGQASSQETYKKKYLKVKYPLTKSYIAKYAPELFGSDEHYEVLIDDSYDADGLRIEYYLEGLMLSDTELSELSRYFYFIL